ncbi:hypothetical protein Droror1_Dr00015857 [Drosera rotundifolia]
MEHKSYSPHAQAAITALRKQIQGYCSQSSDLAQDIRTHPDAGFGNRVECREGSLIHELRPRAVVREAGSDLVRDVGNVVSIG